MEVVVRVYFRRLVTIGRDRFPAHGAVLLVANHPAAWTDVLVLDVAFRRELHFIAHESLYHPWIRGLFLKLFESLPVRYRHEGPQATFRNRETFDRCHALFRLGAAIAVFPEGMSGSDCSLRPLRTGAARLLLEHIAAGDAAPALIPVAIHYEDRTRFRTRVDVAVGTPVPTAEAGVHARDSDGAAQSLTGEMARALEATLATAAAHARAGDGAPQALAPLPPHVRAAAGLASVLAVAGVALHAVPAWAIEWVAQHLTGLPQRISFGRILSGVVLIPLWYGVLVTLSAALGGGAWFGVPVAAPFLGVLACREVDRRHAREAATRTPGDGESA
jgi:1-acyl-sn-glycerol-3-phosphate acyltransferase